MQSTIIAVDLAKSVFQIAVSRRPGKVSESHRLTRSQLLRFFAERQPALVVLEACGTAHYWARELQALGHRVQLLPPHEVRSYVHRNKTDRADAEALLEAHRNERICKVPVKSLAQQTLAGLHRMRSAWMADRTARINLLRGLLRELGFSIPVGARHVVVQTLGLLEKLPEPLRPVLAEACQEIGEFEARVAAVEKQLRALAKQTPVVERLQSIPGVGLLTATALVALVGDVQRFPTSRHFASYLGLTPREHSSGLVRRLGAISKAGDSYLRTLMISGARSALYAASRPKDQPDRLRRWALQVHRLRGHNRAAVALANKLARIVWAVWKHDTRFESQAVPA
ncbi:MAG TPA: IS110 family transposase [Candidatus Nitrosotalea sp.]|nr:IS110 family transposase [Candidatus Nitrosotalea sp.]